mmetsp:Transcript_14862/g.40055  ORF Transcript_14862/g.40055 Transcript_14862/m.40055 type:complete len:357 (+) Transcript_14862:459-1529(+)
MMCPPRMIASCGTLQLITPSLLTLTLSLIHVLIHVLPIATLIVVVAHLVTLTIGAGGLGRLLSSLALLLLHLGEHSLLLHLGLAPGLIGQLLGLLEVIGHDDVVEDRTGLDLPQLEAHKLQVVEGIQLSVGLVVGVVNLGGLPLALVVGVLDLLGLPSALELRVGDHGRLPSTILLVVPVLRLLGIGVRNGGLNLIPVFGLLVVGVLNLLLLIPVLGLLGTGVLDLLRGHHVPVLLQGTRCHLFQVNEHLVGVVWLHDEGVHMRELVGLSLDVLLDEVVRAVLGEDDVHLARGEAADVGAEHDGVRGLSTKGLHLRGTGLRDELHVATTAVQVLLMLHGELHYQILARGIQRLRQL